MCETLVPPRGKKEGKNERKNQKNKERSCYLFPNGPSWALKRHCPEHNTKVSLRVLDMTQAIQAFSG